MITVVDWYDSNECCDTRVIVRIGWREMVDCSAFIRKTEFCRPSTQKTRNTSSAEEEGEELQTSARALAQRQKLSGQRSSDKSTVRRTRKETDL